MSSRLSPVTLCLFLFGNRQAIQQIARCPSAPWLGFLFVLSAGFAREYDGESLVHEPWHLVLPLGASLTTSGVLYLMVSFIAGCRQGEVEDGAAAVSYRSFLGLFWMTAPLAWLYAIPVETFLTAGGATRANLWLLGIVATWRVILMIRVIIVVYGARTVFDVTSIVMLFGDVVMLIALIAIPKPILQVMGGIRLTDSERILLDVTLALFVLGFGSLLIWLIGFARACRSEPAWVGMPEDAPSGVRVGFGAWLLGAASLLIWIPVLPEPQAAQQLRYTVEQDLTDGNIHAALKTMSQHQREKFPAHWDPPPRPGYGLNVPELDHVLTLLPESPANETWVREVYVEKLLSILPGRLWRVSWDDSEQVESLISLLERFPEIHSALTEPHLSNLKYHANAPDDEDLSSGPGIAPELRERIRKLAGLPEPDSGADDSKEGATTNPESDQPPL